MAVKKNKSSSASYSVTLLEDSSQGKHCIYFSNILNSFRWKPEVACMENYLLGFDLVVFLGTL